MSVADARPAGLAALLAVLLAGCVYSFVGGGLPGHVRRVAILEMENESAEPLLETDIQQALQAELPRRLGVRLAEEDVADAVVRGTIRSYGEAPASIRPSQRGDPGDPGEAPVVQREVRLTVDIEIYDLVEDRVLWRASGQTVAGSFNPESAESAANGKARAIEELVQRVIEGAQSQW